MPEPRCNGCKYMRTVHATGQWQFYGCYHEPYHGKWIVEIQDCPIGRETDSPIVRNAFSESETR